MSGVGDDAVGRSKTKVIVDHVSPRSLGGSGSTSSIDCSLRDRYSFLGEEPLLSPPSMISPKIGGLLASSYTQQLWGAQRSPASNPQVSQASAHPYSDQAMLLPKYSDLASKLGPSNQSMGSDSIRSPDGHTDDERQDKVVEADDRRSYLSSHGSDTDERSREGEERTSMSVSTATFSDGASDSSKNDDKNQSPTYLPLSSGGFSADTADADVALDSCIETTADLEILQQRLLVSQTDASFVPHMEQMLADYNSIVTVLVEENGQLKRSLQHHDCPEQKDLVTKTENASVGLDPTREELLLSTIERLEEEKARVQRNNQVAVGSLQKDLALAESRYVDAKKMLHKNAKLLVAAREFITTQKKRGASQPTSPSSIVSEKDEAISELVNKIAVMKKEETRKNEAVLNCLHEVMMFLFQKTDDGSERDPLKLVASVRRTSQLITAQLAKPE